MCNKLDTYNRLRLPLINIFSEEINEYNDNAGEAKHNSNPLETFSYFLGLFGFSKTGFIIYLVLFFGLIFFAYYIG